MILLNYLLISQLTFPGVKRNDIYQRSSEVFAEGFKFVEHAAAADINE